jgi:hypothetical protein
LSAVSIQSTSPIAEPSLLNVQIPFEQGDLPAKRHFLHATCPERLAEQFAQTRDHAIGGIRIFVPEFRNHV